MHQHRHIQDHHPDNILYHCQEEQAVAERALESIDGRCVRWSERDPEMQHLMERRDQFHRIYEEVREEGGDQARDALRRYRMIDRIRSDVRYDERMARRRDVRRIREMKSPDVGATLVDCSLRGREEESVRVERIAKQLQARCPSGEVYVGLHKPYDRFVDLETICRKTWGKRVTIGVHPRSRVPRDPARYPSAEQFLGPQALTRSDILPPIAPPTRERSRSGSSERGLD